MDIENLVLKAKEAQKLSYSPYSLFPVGAAILMKDGKIILGSNIENASYPLSVCAERCALFSAHSLGYKKEDMMALAIIANTDRPCSPCGACRQVISELFPHDKPIYLCDKNLNYVETTIDKLLPFSFSEEDLK